MYHASRLKGALLSKLFFSDLQFTVLIRSPQLCCCISVKRLKEPIYKPSCKLWIQKVRTYQMNVVEHSSANVTTASQLMCILMNHFQLN